VIGIDSKEKRWGRDHQAYRSLRKQGLQPKGIDGSAVLADRAATKEEVQMGHLFTKREWAEVRAGTERAREAGLI
jgi:hypothetical protein